MRQLRRWEDDLIERIKADPGYAVGYLNAALEEEDGAIFLLALGQVVKALGGVSKLSQLSKLHRVNLHRILSKAGNPELKSLSRILHALGLKLAIATYRPSKLHKAA